MPTFDSGVLEQRCIHKIISNFHLLNNLIKETKSNVLMKKCIAYEKKTILFHNFPGSIVFHFLLFFCSFDNKNLIYFLERLQPLLADFNEWMFPSLLLKVVCHLGKK